jgi:AAA family ATP:ADP antiporter
MSPSRDDALDQNAAGAAAVAALLLIASQVASRAVRDALFLSAFSVASLPLAMAGAAVTALAGAEALSLALTRRSPARVVPAVALLSALMLGAWYAVGLVSPRAAALLLYLHVAAFGGALVSGFWSLVNERFDPHAARRYVGRIGTGATAGGLAGGALAWLAAQLVPLAASVLLLVGLGVLSALALRRASGGAASPSAPAQPSSAQPPLAAAILLRDPHIRNVALLVFLGAVTEALVDFQFKAQSSERFGSGSRLLGTFAAFHTAMGLLALLLQATFSRAALRQLGIAGTLALRPLLTAVSALLAAFSPRFETATLARGAHESLTNSLFRSAYELLYTPVPEAVKRRVKTIVDVSIDKAGMLVGSALVALSLALVPRGAESLVFALAVVVAIAALALSRPLHRGYVQTLEQSLLAGRVRLDDVEVIDHTTQLTLAQTGHLERDTLLRQIAALRGEDKSAGPKLDAGAAARADATLDALVGLRSGDPRLVRNVLRANREPTPELVAGMLPLLAQDALVGDVVRALRRVAPRVTGQLVDALLDPELDRVVRRRVPRVLKACGTLRAAEGLKAALDDDAFDVRAAATTALAAMHETSALVQVPRDEVLQRVRRELDSGETLERQIPQIYALLSLTLERGPLQIAWAAMKSEDRSLRGTALEYLANVLPEDVFQRLRSCFGAFTWSAEPVARPVAELADELRHSAVGLKLERPPWRETGDTG